MATAWSSRSRGYKAGVGGLLLGFLWYLLGFALPFWLTKGNVYFGLWLVCLDAIEDECKAVVNRDNASWFQAVQALECLGLIGLVAASLFAVIINCRHAIPPHSRFLEFVSVFGGACGFISCIVFVGKTHEIYDAIDQYYGWGFALNLAGSILVVVSAVVIGTGNRSSLASEADAGAVIQFGGVPAMQGANTVVVQQGAVYPAPAALGVQPAYGYDQGVSVIAQYPGGFPPAPPQAGYPGGIPGPAPPQAGYTSPAAFGGNN